MAGFLQRPCDNQTNAGLHPGISATAERPLMVQFMSAQGPLAPARHARSLVGARPARMAANDEPIKVALARIPADMDTEPRSSH